MKRFLLAFFAIYSIEAQSYEDYSTYYSSGDITVGPDDSSSATYIGANGLLNAISAAIAAGASAAYPIEIYINPGNYTMPNFGLSDGVNLIGTSSTSPPVLYVDYASVNSATCALQNISFQPQTLTNSAFNVLDSTVTFINCSIGNLNASMGTCSITCDGCTVVIPSSTSGFATFTFSQCTLYNFLTSSAPVTVTATATSLADNFIVSCGSPLDIYLSECVIGNGTYSNISTMTLNLTPTTILGTIVKTYGTDAVVVVTGTP